MGKFVLIIILILANTNALVRPWFGFVVYYFLALLGPQYIWWWNFQDLRTSFWIAVFTLLGIAIKITQHKYDFNFLKTKLNFWVFLLWLFVTLSYFLGPYVSAFNSSGRSPDQLFSITNNIFLL